MRLGVPVAILSFDKELDLLLKSSNPGLEGPCGIVSIFSAQYAVPVFQTRHKTKAQNQSPNSASLQN